MLFLVWWGIVRAVKTASRFVRRIAACDVGATSPEGTGFLRRCWRNPQVHQYPILAVPSSIGTYWTEVITFFFLEPY